MSVVVKNNHEQVTKLPEPKFAGKKTLFSAENEFKKKKQNKTSSTSTSFFLHVSMLNSRLFSRLSLGSG